MPALGDESLEARLIDRWLQIAGVDASCAARLRSAQIGESKCVIVTITGTRHAARDVFVHGALHGLALGAGARELF